MASQTLIFGNPTFLPPLRFKRNSTSLSSPNRVIIPNFNKPRSLSLTDTKLISSPNAKLSFINKNPKIYACTPVPNPSSTNIIKPPTQTQSKLTGSTRRLTTLLTITLALTGSLFFAAINNRPASGLNTLLTMVAAGISVLDVGVSAVAAGMSMLLDIYSAVLMIRIMLSWFPNIPWDNKPFSALRDLCDPFLNRFRNLIPPLFNVVDISSFFAFALLLCFTEILKTSANSFYFY